MNCRIIDQSQLDAIDTLLQEHLIASGVRFAMLIDTAGNTIAKCDDGSCSYDSNAFAALAAGNFATVDSMAKLVGETEFSLLFHKGERASIHFSKVSDDLLLITTFDEEVSLGFLRLKLTELIEEIRGICRTDKK